MVWMVPHPLTHPLPHPLPNVWYGWCGKRKMDHLPSLSSFRDFYSLWLLVSLDTHKGGTEKLYKLGCPPSQDAIVTTRIIPFLIGNPELNLHLWLVLGGGTTQLIKKLPVWWLFDTKIEWHGTMVGIGIFWYNHTFIYICIYIRILYW